MSEPLRLCDLTPTYTYVGGFSARPFECGKGWGIWDVAQQRTIAYVETRDEQTDVVWRLNHELLAFEEVTE